MELILSWVGVLVLSETIRTYIYIKSLSKNRRKRWADKTNQMVLNLTDQLYTERRENRLMSDLLKDLVKEV